LPGGTNAGFSNAFKNLGSIIDAVASEPICKNSLRFICIKVSSWFLVLSLA
jgi:hypothetical protein